MWVRLKMGYTEKNAIEWGNDGTTSFFWVRYVQTNPYSYEQMVIQWDCNRIIMRFNEI